jgi:AraC-like DNA-binding protein
MTGRPHVNHPAPFAHARAELGKTLAQSDPGDIRIGPILALPDVLGELGARPSDVFAEAGFDLALFDDPNSRVPFDAMGRLLEACEAATGCEHFGLLAGARFDLGGLGPIGRLMRNEATVGDALRSLVLHLHLHDRGATLLLLAPEPGSALLGYSIYNHDMPAIGQAYDAVVAMAYGALRELCGPSWKPRRVQFSHGRPADITPYLDVFGADIFFNADISGVVFASSWLDRTIEGADPALRDGLAAALNEAESADGLSFLERIRITVRQLILGGAATSGNIARLFAVEERTIRRRLRKQGINLRQLINEERFELARQLLRNAGLSVAEVAAALGYADPNAFSRAFRGWAHISPTEWRTRHAARKE